MKKPALSALFLVIMLFSVNAYLQETSVPRAGEEPQTGVQTLGDNPLQPLFSWSGNVGINFTKAVFLGIGNPADTLFLNTLPPNADIVQAYFAITSWQNTATTASATFNATSLGPDSAAAIDQGSIYFLSHYRWDVTDLIDGNGAFPFTTSDINLCYLVYLLVLLRLQYLSMMVRNLFRTIHLRPISTTQAHDKRVTYYYTHRQVILAAVLTNMLF